MTKLAATLAAFLGLVAAPAGAATLTPIAASTTDLVGSGSVDNVIDGVIDYDAYAMMGPLASGVPFAGPFTVSFELDGAYDLTGMTLWNNGGYIELDGEGIDAFTLVFRDATSIVGTYDGAATDVLAPQAFSFAAAGVSSVDLVINSNHIPASRPYAVFHEINFEGATAVPLPATVLLFATGLGGLLLRARRRG